MSSKSVIRICFVTGTRAEFGLMQSTMAAIRIQPLLQLQIIATGMHLSRKHGSTVREIRRQGWTVDATVPWKSDETEAGNATATGRAMTGITAALRKLKTDIVLVVGDRAEAFAAAAAGHVAGLVVAHVHGGDRALGQADDSLRHAITKLAHLHFPATRQSELRILRMGEDRWRVRRVGSPGVDGIVAAANPGSAGLARGRYALLILHPTGTDHSLEFRNAALVLKAVRDIPFQGIVVIFPNNDPGSAGIIRCWEMQSGLLMHRDVSRPAYLAMLRDAAVLVGNSSSGIIEAASFGTPVIDIGPRQRGRERSQNLVNVPFENSQIKGELQRIWNEGQPLRCPRKNVYGGDGAGRKIAEILAGVKIDDRLRRKLIAY